MKRQIILAFLVCFSPAARSQPAAPEPYPDPQCTKPRTASVRPPVQVETGRETSVDSGAVGSYNSRIKAFNRESAAYSACMHAYIDSASRDVKIIQDKANADLKQIAERANASMKVIQDKIAQAAADANEVSATLNRDTAKLRK